MLELLLNFEKENDCNSIFEELCVSKNTKYNLNFEELDVKLKEEKVGKIYKINKYIEKFKKIYINKLILKEKIEQEEIKEEKCYIINKNWIDSFLKFFLFNKILKSKKNNFISNKNNKYEEESLMNEIILQLPPNFFDELNKRVKSKGFGLFKKVEYFESKLFKKEEEEKKYEIDIINESIFKIINEIFELKYEESIVLMGKGKFIIKLINENSSNQNIALIYSLKNNIFLLFEIKIVFEKEEYLNDFINNFKTKGINGTFNNTTFDEENKYIIYNHEQKIGIAYKNPNINKKDIKRIDTDNKKNESNIEKKEIETNEINDKKEKKINLESSKNLNKEENNSIDSDKKKIEITEIDDNKIDINFN